MSQCDITPISAFQSTNLSNKITSFNRLSERILRSLGYPFINVEVHRDQLYENISIACEMFTKFAGYTREYILFNSNLYEKDVGIRLDSLVTLNDASVLDQTKGKTSNPQYTNYVPQQTVAYVVNTATNSGYFNTSTSLSAALSGGLFVNEIFDTTIYSQITAFNSSLSANFTQTSQRQITQLGTPVSSTKYNNSFDYDVMDYRKVIAITDFEQGSTTGINTLFTIEQTLAQQTYFSYAMGNYGFDLISWYVLKDWLNNREKLLAIKPSYDFNERTQLMRIYPQPKAGESTSQYYGVISCYVEKPLRDVIQEQWVYQYSLALTKIVLARVRGKYQGTTLFGGGSVNADMLSEGLAEKEKLEEQLYTGATPGLGDNEPPLFFVG
jgi:hypothetical protein